MLRATLLVFLLAGTTAAKDSIATVTAANSIVINGVTVDTKGVPALPLVSGDRITTAGEPAIVSLNDGSVFKLAKDSSVRVQKCDVTDIEVLQGTVNYKFAKSSKAQVCALGHPITSKAMAEGSISIRSPQEAVLQTLDLHDVSLPAGQCRCALKTGTPIISTKLLVIGVAALAAAGIAAGIALTAPGSVSPIGQ